MINKKIYWIWAEFSYKDEKKIKKIRDLLRKNFDSPNFNTHLTLAGPIGSFGKSRISMISNLCKSCSPININCFGFDCKDQFFKSFFLKVNYSQELYNLRTELLKINNLKNNEIYEPHISLIYGNHDRLKKKQFIDLLSPFEIKMCIEKICIVDVDENNAKWDVIKSFNITN